MEPTGAAVCLICFELTENHIYVPSDAPAEIFSSCNKYLHSALTQENLKDVQLSDENQLPLCKSCFDSALELTQLSQQLTAIEKDLSDLTVAFSMAVFHRRSQVYKLSQMQSNSASFQNSSIIEFNEACLPPNLFSNKTDDHKIKHYNNSHDIVINSSHTKTTKTNIANVKLEIGDFPFGSTSGYSQPLVANEDTETLFNKENTDKRHCRQPTIEYNENLQPASKIANVNVVGENGSTTCTNRNNGMQLSMSDLLKSVKMPEIKLERINIEGFEVDPSTVNSYLTQCESRKKIADVTLLTNEDLAEASYGPSSSGSEKFEIVHHRSHTREKQYKCSFCPQKFVSRPNQKIHERMHTGNNPFKCSYCEKRFHAMTNLLVHERVHTGEKPYECSFCDKKFAQFGALKQHERIHTGEKPYKCSFCEKSFAVISSMKSHEWTHTGEKPFKCSVCKKGFSSLGALKLHERHHTGEKPFQCSVCKKGFSSFGAVKLHERVHTGEKPFQCSFCDKRFALKAILQNHERIHTGEKPYKCLYCDKSFSQISGQRSHQKTHRKKRLQSLMCPICNLKCGSLAHLKHHEKMHSITPVLFKCSFCEMTFNSNEDRNIHENTHSIEDQIVNENLQTFIVGI